MLSRSRSFDGLRGLAAAAVVSSHLTGSLGVLPFATGGYIGVLVFFALSGYLITKNLWAAPPTSHQYRSFARRRFRRLMPVVAVLVVLGLPTLILVGHQDAWSMAVQAALALTQTTAFAAASGLEGHPVWGPTWSLTVEWIFYLGFPLVLSALRRQAVSTRNIRRALMVGVACLYVAGLLLHPQTFYWSPVANLAVMLSGAVLALHHHDPDLEQRRPDPARGVAGLVLLGLLVVCPAGTPAAAYKFVVFPAVAAASLLVINECRHAGRVSSLLAARPLVVVGLSAYSLYIWHMPVIWLTFVTVPELPRPVIGAIAMALVLPLVTASYLLLERPVLRRSKTEPSPESAPSTTLEPGADLALRQA